MNAHRSLAVFVAAAVLLGGVAGWQLRTMGVDGTPTAAAPPSASPSPSAFGPPHGVLALLERPQEAADIPPPAALGEFDVASFRTMGAGIVGMNGKGTVTMYGARTRSGLVCLIALAATDRYLSACAHPAEFPATGLRLYWPLRYLAPTLDGGMEAVTLDVTSTWLPDGTLEGGWSRRGGH